MIKETVVIEVIKTIFSLVTNQLKKVDIKLSSSKDDMEKALFQHIRVVKNWSEEVNFKDLKKSKRTQSIYIELNLFLYPRSVRISEEEQIESISLTELLKKEKNHIAILGQPGAGKTTSMKFICQSIFLNEKFFPEFRYPILVKLRDFNKPLNTDNTAGIIIEFLFNILGLKFNETGLVDKGAINKIKEKLVIDCLETLSAIVIIEGFDEVSFKKHQNIILKEIELLANQLETSKIIITSRSADFPYSFENISDYEFCSLNETQIKQFAIKWLKSKKLAENFLKDVQKSPFADTTIRPLTIAHLCAIYERVGKIPDKPKTVYRKIINLLLEEWDEQRNIKRESKYAYFETDRKFEFLSALAYHLTVSSRKAIFSKNNLLITYAKIHQDFDLDYDEGLIVVKELESHTGLFIQAGYDMYEFAHKSLQEYLTAEYIVKLPFIPFSPTTLDRLPNEMAIAISISSNSSLYFIEIVELILRSKLTLPFIQTFINRLMLEKPDFNSHESIGINALLLYTKYLKLFMHEGGNNQLSLFIIDDIVADFEAFIEQIFKRNSKELVFNQYDIIEKFDSTNGSKILALNLKKDTINNRLPKLLYCRDKFI